MEGFPGLWILSTNIWLSLPPAHEIIALPSLLPFGQKDKKFKRLKKARGTVDGQGMVDEEEEEVDVRAAQQRVEREIFDDEGEAFSLSLSPGLH